MIVVGAQPASLTETAIRPADGSALDPAPWQAPRASVGRDEQADEGAATG